MAPSLRICLLLLAVNMGTSATWLPQAMATDWEVEQAASGGRYLAGTSMTLGTDGSHLMSYCESSKVYFVSDSSGNWPTASVPVSASTLTNPCTQIST